MEVAVAEPGTSYPPGIRGYIRFLRDTVKTGDRLYSGARLVYPLNAHPPTVSVWISLLAGAGIIKKIEKGVYEATADLFDPTEETLIEVYSEHLKRQRANPRCPRQARLVNFVGKRAEPETPAEPEVEEVEVDVVD